jgi:hypothetical protein
MKILTATALLLVGSIASAAPLSNKTYSTPIAAAKAEMARRLDGSREFRQVYGTTGVKGMTARTLTAKQALALGAAPAALPHGDQKAINVIFNGRPYHGQPEAIVNVVKSSAGYRAVKSKYFNGQGLGPIEQ